jgi:NAD(P)-dependent dehydrogenase (short-subunit alcohol dehydrogenase family)
LPFAALYNRPLGGGGDVVEEVSTPALSVGIHGLKEANMVQFRVALVTGANRGIGLEIARELARRGIKVALGSRDVAKGEAAAAALKAQGLDVAVVRLDVTEEGAAARAVAEVEKLLGAVDVLVNNGAVLLDDGGFEGSLLDLGGDVLRRTMETNVAGPLRMLQAVVPGMRERRYGRIVNLSSGAGQLADMRSGFPAYRMSKAALNALTRIAATELKDVNIKVNAACPGWVRTDMGGPEADRSVEEGADTPVWLATLADDGPTSGFFRDRKPIPW